MSYHHFKIGDRVKLNVHAYKNGVRIGRRRMGTIIGDGYYPCVIWDNLSPYTKESYSPDYLEKIKPRPKEERDG